MAKPETSSMYVISRQKVDHPESLDNVSDPRKRTIDLGLYLLEPFHRIHIASAFAIADIGVMYLADLYRNEDVGRALWHRTDSTAVRLLTGVVLNMDKQKRKRYRQIVHNLRLIRDASSNAAAWNYPHNAREDH